MYKSLSVDLKTFPLIDIEINVYYTHACRIPPIYTHRYEFNIFKAYLKLYTAERFIAITA